MSLQKMALLLREGQNEAGLAISGNFLPGFTEYQTVTPQDKNYVSVINFGGFILRMFGSVKELRTEIPKYPVWYDPSEVKGIPTPPWIHYVLTDRTGDSIIVEFVKRQMVTTGFFRLHTMGQFERFEQQPPQELTP